MSIQPILFIEIAVSAKAYTASHPWARPTFPNKSAVFFKIAHLDLTKTYSADHPGLVPATLYTSILLTILALRSKNPLQI
ncbi:MAG: hypothetical protein H7096_00430 [Flavobacterium sp.]|nr:hypothetical protein [Pedobacter sp.]